MNNRKVINSLLTSFIFLSSVFISNDMVNAEDSERVFNDVPSEYNEVLEYMKDKDIIKGYIDGSFRPYEFIQRKHAAIIIARSLGGSPDIFYPEAGFVDVSKNYKWAINFLYQKGIMNGKSANNFGSEDYLTKGQMDMIMSRIYKIKPIKDNINIEEKVNRLELIKYIYDANLLNKEREIDYSVYKLNDYFNDIEWIMRGDIVSLSIYPKAYIINTPENHSLEKHLDNSFEQIVNLYSTDVRWYNTESMKLQYKCHVAFAGNNKVPWNIEPHRKSVDYIEVILGSCNP